MDDALLIIPELAPCQFPSGTPNVPTKKVASITLPTPLRAFCIFCVYFVRFRRLPREDRVCFVISLLTSPSLAPLLTPP